MNALYNSIIRVLLMEIERSTVASGRVIHDTFNQLRFLTGKGICCLRQPYSYVLPLPSPKLLRDFSLLISATNKSLRTTIKTWLLSALSSSFIGRQLQRPGTADFHLSFPFPHVPSKLCRRLQIDFLNTGHFQS